MTILTKESIYINGVRIDNVNMEESVNYIINMASSSGKHLVTTPNLDFLYNASRSKEFQEILNSSSLNVPDGKPLIYLSKLQLGRELKEKVSGADLFVNICQEAPNRNIKIFLLGSAEGIALKAKKSLEAKFKGVNIVGAVSPSFGFEKNESESLDLIDQINESDTDILFVGVGSPKQEFWIHKNLNKLKVKVAIGVGASFDFEAGLVQIPPPFIKKIGFAWLWRLALDPKRLWKRYIVNNLPLLIILTFRSVFNRNG